MNEQLLKDWNVATGNLSWGVQRVFLETLYSVKDHDVHLVHGADYRDGKPCLVNAVASMLTTSSNGVSPLREFPKVVGLFDQINKQLQAEGVNSDDGFVSPLAAEILIRNFGNLKPEPDIDTSVVEASHGAVYIEPTDEEFAKDWLDSMKSPAPCDITANDEAEIERLASIRSFGSEPDF